METGRNAELLKFVFSKQRTTHVLCSHSIELFQLHHKTDQITLTPDIGTNPAIYIKWVLGNQHTHFLLVCLLHSHHIVE